jgi:two-component system response regulator TtrR
MTAATEPTVYIVDDDSSTRELLAWLMKRNGLAARTFENGPSFLEACGREARGCVLLDLNLPGMSGIELQQKLTAAGIGLPIIFVSGGADVPRAVQAVKGGAVDFVEKPFDYRRIVALVHECLARDAAGRAEREKGRQAADRLATLSQREREVLERVVSGKPNRVIAEELDISIKTVEAHRARIMEKLEVGSLAELVQATLAVRN